MTNATETRPVTLRGGSLDGLVLGVAANIREAHATTGDVPGEVLRVTYRPSADDPDVWDMHPRD